jgi:NADPH-dependent ferric siderophore reductase
MRDDGDVRRWHGAHLLHRGEVAAGASPLLVDAVRAADLPDGPVFAWLAGEASNVR